MQVEKKKAGAPLGEEKSVPNRREKGFAVLLQPGGSPSLMKKRKKTFSLLRKGSGVVRVRPDCKLGKRGRKKQQQRRGKRKMRYIKRVCGKRRT